MYIFIVDSVSWGSDCSGVWIQIDRYNHGVGTYLTMYEDSSVLLFFSLLKRELRNPITYHLGYDLKAIVQVSRVSYLQSVLISFSSATGSAKILSMILTISTKLPCGNSRRGFFSTSTMWQAGSMISLIRTSISTLAPLALDFEHSDLSQRIVGKVFTQ